MNGEREASQCEKTFFFCVGFELSFVRVFVSLYIGPNKWAGSVFLLKRIFFKKVKRPATTN